MVKKVSVILVDDLSGGQADETVKFGVDGTGYEIDLNLRNAQDLRVLLARYIEKGRKITSPASRPSRSPRTATDEASNKKMRSWAKEQGFKISDRGRVSAEIVAKYEAETVR
jgi:hypothetical protein